MREWSSLGAGIDQGKHGTVFRRADPRIVICGNNEFIPWKDYGVVDCACAMENIMIAAPAVGLGTVCIGGFDRRTVKEQLAIPDGIEAVGMLYVGYPDKERQPRTKYLEEAVHDGDVLPCQAAAVVTVHGVAG